MVLLVAYVFPAGRPAAERSGVGLRALERRACGGSARGAGRSTDSGGRWPRRRGGRRARGSRRRPLGRAVGGPALGSDLEASTTLARDVRHAHATAGDGAGQALPTWPSSLAPSPAAGAGGALRARSATVLSRA